MEQQCKCKVLNCSQTIEYEEICDVSLKGTSLFNECQREKRIQVKQGRSIFRARTRWKDEGSDKRDVTDEIATMWEGVVLKSFQFSAR